MTYNGNCVHNKWNPEAGNGHGMMLCTHPEGVGSMREVFGRICPIGLPTICPHHQEDTDGREEAEGY